MDKEQLEILKRQDTYNSRMFWLCLALAIVIVVQCISTNNIVKGMADDFDSAITDVIRIDADKELEIVHTYFGTDYDYGEYHNNITQEVEVTK